MNPYNEHLISFYETVVDLFQANQRICNVLLKDLDKFSKENSLLFVGTKILVRDWTYPIGNGSEYASTGIQKILLKQTYAPEVENIISRECCLTYAQVFENMENFFKNIIIQRCSRDEEFEQLLKLRGKSIREGLRGREALINSLKKAGKENFDLFSRDNFYGIAFKEFWDVLGEARHAITHNNSRIEKTKINISANHFELFKRFFDYKELESDILYIRMNKNSLKIVFDLMTGFSFQIYKIVSLEEKLPFKIRVNETNGKRLSDSNPHFADFLNKI